MPEAAGIYAFEGLIGSVQERVHGCIQTVAGSVGWTGGIEGLFSGKMLRTRLAGRLAAAEARVERGALVDLCAAIELLHVASLCHDDVIDNAQVRRGTHSLWVAAGASAAVLMGDRVLCEAMDLARGAAGGAYLGPFMSKAREVLDAEIQQEIACRGRALEEAMCLALARGKTGPLFAFPAGVCGGADAAVTAALEEAGYQLGTAYQLADDLLDVLGDERSAGKTLGTDRQRGKFTLPHMGPEGPGRTRDHIARLCRGAAAGLEPYPRLREGLGAYLTQDFLPALGLDSPR
ncbi:MAG: polyprenyl synthetase family protein [Planctomycetota bacterium]|nr:polyprenyl synthetase family protein [Planctomycetota bacterium]